MLYVNFVICVIRVTTSLAKFHDVSSSYKKHVTLIRLLFIAQENNEWSTLLLSTRYNIAIDEVLEIEPLAFF